MPRFVQKLDINGVKTRQIPCIELHGRPNAATRGAVGVLGIDVDSPAHEMYKCVAVNGAIYTWEEMSDTASLPKIVNVLSNPAGDYSADTSFEEIFKAHEAGKVVIALCDGSYYYLAGADSERVRFTACVTSADGLSVGEITISTSENGDVVEYNLVSAGGASSGTKIIPFTNVYMGTTSYCSTSVPFGEIYQAYLDGMTLVATAGNAYYYLSYISDTEVRFVRCHNTDGKATIDTMTLTSSQVASSSRNEPGRTKVVTLTITSMTSAGTTYSSDTAPTEIAQAVSDGQVVVARFRINYTNPPTSAVYHLADASTSSATFILCGLSDGKMRISKFTIDSNKNATLSSGETIAPTKVVTISSTYVGGEAGFIYESDTTSDEIAQAVSNGQVVAARVTSISGTANPAIYYLANISNTEAMFSRCTLSGEHLQVATLTVDSDKKCTMSSGGAIEPTKVVTISAIYVGTGFSYTSDTTFAEIEQAYSAGQVVLARFTQVGVTSPDIYYLTSVSTTKAIFSLSALSGENLQIATFTIDSDGNVTKSSGGAIEPTKVVTISSTYVGTGFSYTTDTTLAEINQAVSAGQVVVARTVTMGTTTPSFVYLTSVSATEVAFSQYTPSPNGYISVTTYKIDSNNLVSTSGITVYTGLPYTGPSQVTDETRITESGYYYAYVTGTDRDGIGRYYNFGVFYYTSALRAYTVQLEEASALLDIFDGKLTFWQIAYYIKDDGVSIGKTKNQSGDWTIYLAKVS